MTAKIYCDLFHHTDGKCCPDGCSCMAPAAPPVHIVPTALEVAMMHSSAQRGMLAGLVVLTMFTAVFVCGAVALEKQQRQVDIAMQEMRP